MKIVQINSFSNGSTGKIMMSIHKALINQGYDSYVVWGRGRKSENDHEIYLNDKIGVYFHALFARLTGKVGFASKRSTKKLLKILDEIKPDIIHLHNIHGYYINVELLFNYIREQNIKVIWTLHDCWPFTGQCPHFTLENCYKWKKGCNNCPMTNEYPKTIKDNSKWNYQKKKEIFNGLNITIVTPSKWLANLVKKSFLKEYPVKVINNGVDKNIFKPIYGHFRTKYHLENKKIILGVANVWDKRKGLNDFIELAKILEHDYVIVIVGLKENQLHGLPDNIIGITKTENQQELANIYSESNIFFNASKEESFGLTTVEALSCGLPVIVYNSTALPEIVPKGYGTIIDKYDVHELYCIIKKNVTNKRCVRISNDFDITKMINNYLNLYNQKRGNLK